MNSTKDLISLSQSTDMLNILNIDVFKLQTARMQKKVVSLLFLRTGLFETFVGRLPLVLAWESF